MRAPQKESMGCAKALISDQLSPCAEQIYQDLIMLGSSPMPHADFESPEDFHILRTALRDDMSFRQTVIDEACVIGHAPHF